MAPPRRLHATGETGRVVTAAVTEGLRNPAAIVDDYRVFGRPWGFEPDQVGVPTSIWQGDADDLVPPAWADQLAAAIEASSLEVVPGAGHLLWYDHWSELFAGITATIRRS
jgi:pimeloyl-ACP methyl ester carboxylesterase